MKKEKERAKSFILWFDEIGIISLVGGKNASLGEMRKFNALRHFLLM